MTPDEWDYRHVRWVKASNQLAPKEDPWLVVAIQDLAWVERNLITQESEVSRALRAGESMKGLQPNTIFSEYQAHSKLWIMGLYEACRVMINDRNIPEAPSLKPLFEKLEAIRIPFAKHEPRKTRGEIYFPTPCTPLFGYELGWMVKDYKHKLVPSDAPKGAHVNFYASRRQLADEFLHSVDGEW